MPDSALATATLDQTDKKALTKAVKRLTAIAHEGRLSLMRLLVQAGPEGELAGNLARKAGVGATTASAQLQVLANADLVSAERRGRQVVYRADYATLEGVLGFLLEDCCGGRSEICAPLARRLVGVDGV